MRNSALDSRATRNKIRLSDDASAGPPALLGDHGTAAVGSSAGIVDRRAFGFAAKACCHIAGVVVSEGDSMVDDSSIGSAVGIIGANCVAVSASKIMVDDSTIGSTVGICADCVAVSSSDSIVDDSTVGSTVSVAAAGVAVSSSDSMVDECTIGSAVSNVVACVIISENDG